MLLSYLPLPTKKKIVDSRLEGADDLAHATMFIITCLADFSSIVGCDLG